MGLFGKKEVEPEVIEKVEEKVEEAVEKVEEKKDSKTTVIGQGVKLTGDFNAAEDITIYGYLEGTIVSDNDLVIAEGGYFKGTANVANLLLAGEIEGEITVKGLSQLTERSKFSGSLVTKELLTEKGSAYEGSLSIKPNAQSEPAAAYTEPAADEPVLEDLINE